MIHASETALRAFMPYTFKKVKPAKAYDILKTESESFLNNNDLNLDINERWDLIVSLADSAEMTFNLLKDKIHTTDAELVYLWCSLIQKDYILREFIHFFKDDPEIRMTVLKKAVDAGYCNRFIEYDNASEEEINYIIDFLIQKNRRVVIGATYRLRKKNKLFPSNIDKLDAYYLAKKLSEA